MVTVSGALSPDAPASLEVLASAEEEEAPLWLADALPEAFPPADPELWEPQAIRPRAMTAARARERIFLVMVKSPFLKSTETMGQ